MCLRQFIVVSIFAEPKILVPPIIKGGSLPLFSEPQVLATLSDGKTYVSHDKENFYPIHITTGVLDAAVYNQVY